MENSTKALYALIGIILPIVLLIVDIVYFSAAIFPIIWLFLWLSLSIIIILPWAEHYR